MIAVDTNVVLRLVLDDHEAQVAAARALLAREPWYVSLTVLLEVGWVLESRYGLPRADVAEALILLTRLDRIVVARLPLALKAIERYRAGADLADMVHLVAAAKVGRFATFDRHMAKYAGPGAEIMIETLA